MSLVDLSDIEELADEVAIGRVWSGPPWAVGLAIDAINRGDIPVPEYLPDEIRPYITTTTPPRMPPVEPPAHSSGWTCPAHGMASVKTQTTRKGRTYRVCAECPEFEKEPFSAKIR